MELFLDEPRSPSIIITGFACVEEPYEHQVNPCRMGFTGLAYARENLEEMQRKKSPAPKPGQNNSCNFCGALFPSKNKLFEHIKRYRHQARSATPQSKASSTVNAVSSQQLSQTPNYKLCTDCGLKMIESHLHGDRVVTSTTVGKSPESALNPMRAFSTNYFRLRDASVAPYLSRLEEICHTFRVLRDNGYNTKYRSSGDVEGARRCLDCGIYKQNSACKCEYRHKFSVYSCGRVQSVSCPGYLSHNFEPLEKSPLFKWKDHLYTPTWLQKGSQGRAAVAIDCEMVEVVGGRCEIVRLSVVDFISGETLIDKYVRPNERVTNWRTWITGVSKRRLDNLPPSKVLSGWQAARKELRQYVDDNTIFVGHAMHHDLNVLRVLHYPIVDTAILAKRAIAKDCKRQFGLKTLCQDLLGRTIQESEKGHSSLEDAMATREVTLYCLRDPGLLKEWASKQAMT